MASFAVAKGSGVAVAAGGAELEAGDQNDEQLEALLALSAPVAQRPWKRWAGVALVAWAGAAAASLLVALGTHRSSLTRAPPQLGAARPARADVAAVVSAAEETAGLLEGEWAFGEYGLFRIRRDARGTWEFREQISSGEDIEGALHPAGGWLEGNLSTASGERQGTIRLRRGRGQTLVLNYLAEGAWSWGETKDVVAHEASNGYYIILEVFRLTGTHMVFGGLYHSQIAICPKSAFSDEERSALDGLKLDPARGFAEVPSELWRNSEVSCRRLSYGGAPNSARCSGVVSEALPLSSDRAEIPNVESGVAWKYLYGDGPFSGAQVASRICGSHCGDLWSGKDYSLVTNNCNTFTSTVLHCVYGLSQVKPSLGVSDMKWVTCEC